MTEKIPMGSKFSELFTELMDDIEQLDVSEEMRTALEGSLLSWATNATSMCALIAHAKGTTDE